MSSLLKAFEYVLKDNFITFAKGVAFVIHLNFVFFFLYALCRWKIIDIIRLLKGKVVDQHGEFSKFPTPSRIFPSPSVPSIQINAGQSLSESCSWLNTFLNDIYFKMNDGELIRTIKENVMEKFINAKLAIIENEYNKLIGKIVLSDLSVRSLPTITAVHVTSAEGIEKDVAIVFDFEYHGGITFQIITKDSVIGSVKFDARLDYFKSKFVLHFVRPADGEKQWILSLSEAPRISIVLGVGKHNLSGIARIIQKALHDLLQKNIVYPNLYKYVVRNNLVGFKNSLFKVDDSKDSHYAIKVVRGRNLPIKHDLKGPFVVVSYGEKSFKTSTAKCLPSPIFGSTFHFNFQDKISTVKISICQKNKLSKNIFTLAQFEFPLALFTKTFQRLRFRLDGSVLNEFNRMASYISFDLIYYEKKVGENALEPLAKFMYGTEADLRIKEVANKPKKKTSNFLTILKATTRDSKKALTSFSSSDLIRYLDGQSTYANSDIQFVQNNLREKTSGLSRFWGQQMEILRGSKRGEASYAAFSDISDSIEKLSKDILKFLAAFKSLQSHQIDVTFKELNEICDMHDSLSSYITQLFRLLGLKSAKDFKFLPQILDYLKEISILLGQINFAIYHQKENLSDAESIMATEREDMSSIYASHSNLSQDLLSSQNNISSIYSPPIMSPSSSKVVVDLSRPTSPISDANSQPISVTSASLSDDEGFFEELDSDAADRSSLSPNIQIQTELDNTSFVSPSLYEMKKSSISPSPSILSNIHLLQKSSEDLQTTYCRLFKSRCTFSFTDSAIDFKPNFDRLFDSIQEGVFYIIDNEQIPRIYSENAFSSLKSDRRVVGHVAKFLVSFSRSEKMNFSSLRNISTLEISKISIRNVKNSHLNLLKFEFAIGNQVPVYIAGEKGVVLKFFSAIASWMVYHDSDRQCYSLKYCDISSVRQTKSSIEIFTRIAATIKGSQELISNNTLILKDFFGQTQRSLTYSQIAGKLEGFSASVTNEVLDVDDEKEDFVFARRSVSPLPQDYYFEHFRLIDKQAPLYISECSIAGENGQVSVGMDGLYFKSPRMYYVVPFFKVQSLRLVNGILVKGIRVTLSNNEIVALSGFKKGHRQPFFKELNDAFLQFCSR